MADVRATRTGKTKGEGARRAPLACCGSPSWTMCSPVRATRRIVPYLRAIAPAVLLLLPLPTQALAQRLTVACVQPAMDSTTADGLSVCWGEPRRTGEMQTQRIELEVQENGVTVAGVLVRMQPSSGTVSPAFMQTGGDGRVRALWLRPRSSDAATITVSAVSQRRSGIAAVHLQPSRQDDRVLKLLQWRGSLSWFERSQLPHSIVLALLEVDPQGNTQHISDPATCVKQRVAFRGGTGAGILSMDTAAPSIFEYKGIPGWKRGNTEADAPKIAEAPEPLIASLVQPERVGCFVTVDWTLGETPGRKTIQARIVPAAGFDAPLALAIQSRARALPRFITGFAYNWHNEYAGLSPGKETKLTVERVENGVTVTYDSTFTSAAAIDSTATGDRVAVIAGVSMPIPISRVFARSAAWIDRLSVTGGVDLTSPSSDWYLGASLGRLVGGLTADALPVDIHLLHHWSSDSVLLNKATCGSETGCELKRKIRSDGIALMISADASSLVSELVKRIAK